MRKRARSQSFLEQAKFYEWNNYSYAARKVTHQKLYFSANKVWTKGVSKIIDSEDRNFSSMKPQQVFPFSLNQNILFLGCSKNNKTYISDILTLFEYIYKVSKLKTWKWAQIFLNGPYFTRNGIIIPVLLIKAVFFKKVNHQNAYLSADEV